MLFIFAELSNQREQAAKETYYTIIQAIIYTHCIVLTFKHFKNRLNKRSDILM